MRSLDRNSPQAAARLVVLALLADGQLTRSEIDALHQRGALSRLGIDRVMLHDLVQDFCDELLVAHGPGSPPCTLTQETLADLLADIDDRTLQRRILRLSLDVVHADGELSDGESIVLEAMARHWALDDALVADLAARTASV